MKNQPLAIFQHDVVNDLAFAIFSDMFLHPNTNFAITLTDERLAWLHQLDNNPESIQLNVASKRLGHYYEALWGYFLQEDNNFTVKAQQLQINSDGKTYGEFDFVVFEHSLQQHLHIEIAIKFYLYSQQYLEDSPKNPNCWLGPNSQDNLGKKQNHMQSQQQQLSQLPQAKKQLAALGIEQVTPVMSLKGFLFSQGQTLPKNVPNGTAMQPYYFADNCQQAFTKTCYLLPKHRWLSQVHQQSSITPIRFEALQQAIKDWPSPKLLCHGHINSQGMLIENQRFFICPTTWPNTKWCLFISGIFQLAWRIFKKWLRFHVPNFVCL